jgi:glyoxylase-like metal-dependent hydrolase (beta-lactamase superfamily II)
METCWQLLLPGIPLTSTRGALGWCSVTLVQAGGRLLLVDTGSYGDRALLLANLRAAGVSPGEVDDVFLTHFHYDHVLNFDLFNNAVFHLSEKEIRYVTQGGFNRVNDPYVPAIAYPRLAPQLKPFAGEVELLPGLRTVPLPGHTPGMTGLLLEQERVLIAGDGVKNAREFLLRQAPPAFAGREEALQSYARAAAVAQTIIPGHDQPFRLPVREEAAYVGSYSLELSLSGNPGAEPQTLRLPTGSIRHPTAAGGTCAQGVPGTAENLN